MKLTFEGSRTADLFSHELEASLDGIIDLMMITDESDPNCGFCPVSLPGHPWDDTLWTRDGGTLLRELVLWGHIHEAKLLAGCLLRSVGKNESGFRMFPMMFHINEVLAGDELDGTGAILIGLAMLERALPDEDPFRARIDAFLLDESSPVFGIFHELGRKPLVAGDGEFGGGFGNDGLFVNSVQNNLLRLAMLAVSAVFERLGESALARRCRETAQRIEENILKYLTDDNGFIWAADPETMRPAETVNNHPCNYSCGLINGIFSMTADVCGNDLSTDNFFAWDTAVRQFDNLHNQPPRAELFDRYGIWVQFIRFRGGATGPSYGHGYAMQCMLLMDRMDMVDKALVYLANETYQPIPEFDCMQERSSPYFIYERYHCPYFVEQGETLEVGCGPLNMVCVAEPLKIGRMMAGFDCAGTVPVLHARLPESITGYHAEDVPLLYKNSVFYADIDCHKTDSGLTYRIRVKNGVLPRLIVRTGAQEQTLCGVTAACVNI